jgi:crotonobetainyl-CoA:carnitine CoA-transferase CaiB-like acyl-CoA transferase
VYWSGDDKPMTLAAIEPKFWANFCHAAGHPEWIAEQLKPDRQVFLKEQLQILFRQKTAAEWDALLAGVDCCFALVTPPEKIVHDPQIQARQAAGIGEDGIPWMRSPVRMQDDDFSIGAVPEYGEHTDAILAEAGYSADEIAQLHAAGAIGRK